MPALAREKWHCGATDISSANCEEQVIAIGLQMNNISPFGLEKCANLLSWTSNTKA